MELRLTTRSEVIARLLLMGMTAAEIARQLNVTRDRVRYHISTPEFQQLVLALHQEHIAALDKKINRLLFLAAKALSKNLRSSDWRARASAIEQVLKMHGRYFERIAISGSLDHTGTINHQHHHQHQITEPEMSERERQLARELLALRRTPKLALPPSIAKVHDVHQDPQP